jgi:hypothetical protein
VKQRLPRGPSFDEVVWGQNHDAFQTPADRAALRNYSLGIRDQQSLELLSQPIHRRQVQEALGQVPPFRKCPLQSPELALGFDETRQLIGIPIQFLNAGTLAVGCTGAGKTIMLLWMALQLAMRGLRLWVSEMYKTQVRNLRQLLGRAGKDLIILGSRDWKFNLLQAGRCDPQAYLTMAVDLLARILALPPRARTILRQICHGLYEHFGIFRGRHDAWPTLFDAFEAVRANTDLNPPARDAILDRLGALLTSLTPKCAAYRLAWDPVDLARFSIVFEMRSAGESVKSLLLNACLFSLLHHEVSSGQFNQRMDHWVCFEDAQRFFHANQEGDGELSPMDELASVIRGSAKGLCLQVQTLNGLSRGIIPNLTTKIMGRLGAHEDYQRLGADMGMTQEQVQWAKLHLRPGRFIVQLADGDWRLPFIINVPHMRVPASVDDREAAESVKALDVLPTIPATEYAHWRAAHMESIAIADPSEPTEPTTEPTASTAKLAAEPVAEPSMPSLNDFEIRYLRAVVGNPGRPSSAYAKLAGMSSRRAQGIRQRLVEAGYLCQHAVANNRRGRDSIVLEPLEPARQAVGRQGGAV